MRKSIVSIMAAALFVTVIIIFSPAAVAETVAITGTVTPVSLGNACSGAGGSFNSYASGYSCTKKDCDGKGGECAVHCTSAGQCIGSTPSARKPGTTLTNRASNLVRILKGSVSTPPAAPGTAKPPSAGIFDTGPTFSPQGPARTGTPSGRGTIY